jgi:hypothetical protein
MARDVVVVHALAVALPFSAGPGGGGLAATQILEMQVLRSVLADHGIASFIRPDPDLDSNGNLLHGIQQYELLVNHEHEAQARELIAEYLAAEPVAE